MSVSSNKGVINYLTTSKQTTRTTVMKMKFPTGKPVLQTGIMSFSQKGSASPGVNCQENASGQFRTSGTPEQEREFSRTHNLALVAALGAAK
jgi:hypothetical protein